MTLRGNRRAAISTAVVAVLLSLALMMTSAHAQAEDRSLGWDIKASLEVPADGAVRLVPQGYPKWRASRVLEQPKTGRATVASDGSLRLVQRHADQMKPDSLTVELIHSDGLKSREEVVFTIQPVTQLQGWAPGRHYLLETDSNGDLVIETGSKHRKLYVTAGPHGLTASEIARLAQVEPREVTPRWLLGRPDMGGTPETALSVGLGSALWQMMARSEKKRSSHWLLLERGFTYPSDTGLFTGFDLNGESPLHPRVIGAFGDGAPPLIEGEVRMMGAGFSNLVISDLVLSNGLFMLEAGRNILLNNLWLRGRETAVQRVAGLTLRNAIITDAVRSAPIGGESIWEPFKSRMSGFYAGSVQHLLLENVFADHNGWAEGYDPDLSAEGGQPPSMFSHNLYLHGSNADVTVRDVLTMRAASAGLHLRSGGVIDGVLYLNNNTAGHIAGGTVDETTGIGRRNMTLFADSVVTSAGYRSAEQIGAIAAGPAADTAVIHLRNSLIAHLADPARPQEVARKVHGNWALTTDPARVLYDDTVVFRWIGSGSTEAYNASQAEFDQNTSDRSVDRMISTSISTVAGAVLGSSDAGTRDVARVMRDLSNEPQARRALTQDLLAGFRKGFGLSLPDHLPVDHIFRFAPGHLTDGFRWDNRLNWEGGRRPPTENAKVDLAGNHVEVSGNTRVAAMNLGPGGALRVNGGRILIATPLRAAGPSGTEVAGVRTEEAGQFWFAGYADEATLDLTVAGGRVANTGSIVGRVDARVAGQGQLLLATEDGSGTVLDTGSVLHIGGYAARVGFDGPSDGVMSLRLRPGARLSFGADGGAPATLQEFRSGHWNHELPQFLSVVDLGGGGLSLDLSGLPDTAGRFVLARADALVGEVGALHVVGLGEDRDLQIQLDYQSDEVVMILGQAGQGSGLQTISMKGIEADHRLLTAAERSDVLSVLSP